MIKQSITYVDYNGRQRTEDFYFNLNETELVEMASTAEGDLAERLKVIMAANDGGKIMMIFKDLLTRAYGEKSEDGRRFVKSSELSKAFFETEAYNQLFLRLVTDPEFAATFIQQIIPANLSEKLGESSNVTSNGSTN